MRLTWPGGINSVLSGFWGCPADGVESPCVGESRPGTSARYRAIHMPGIVPFLLPASVAEYWIVAHSLGHLTRPNSDYMRLLISRQHGVSPGRDEWEHDEAPQRQPGTFKMS